MYFWNTKALSEDIKNNKLSDNDWKNYYLAGSILLILSMYAVELAPREISITILVEMILMIGILVFGINTTFNTHQASGNNITNYISKMTALSLPLIVKLFTLSFAIGLGLALAEDAGLSLEPWQDWIIVALTVSIQALMFWRLNYHLQGINT